MPSRSRQCACLYSYCVDSNRVRWDEDQFYLARSYDFIPVSLPRWITSNFNNQRSNFFPHLRVNAVIRKLQYRLDVVPLARVSIDLRRSVPQCESLRNRQRRVHAPQIRTEDVPANLQRPLREVIAEEVVDVVVLLEYEEFVHVEEGHVRVIVLEFRRAHVIRVHLTMSTGLGQNADGISGITSTILPIP